MARLETQVSKTDPTIKKIIEASSGSDWVDWPGTGAPKKWIGRNVSVVQVDPSFTYQLYNPARGDAGAPRVYIVGSIGSKLTTFRVPPPSDGGPATQINAPDNGEVVVVRQSGSHGTITIYVPELDASVLDVARDALLAGEARRAREVLQQLGPYAGIGAAVIRAQGKTLESVARGEGKTPSRRRELDREIDAFLRTRKR
jgi:hypothetical protein